MVDEGIDLQGKDSDFLHFLKIQPPNRPLLSNSPSNYSSTTQPAFMPVPEQSVSVAAIPY